MRIIYSILMVCIATSLVGSERVTTERSFLQRQYKNFVDDVTLINRCYIQKARSCTQQDLKEAPWAVARVLGKTGGVLLVTVGGYIGVKKFAPYITEQVKEYRKEQPMPEALQANFQAMEKAVKGSMPNLISITWRAPRTLVILLESHRYITNPIIEPMKQALLKVPGIDAVENVVIQIPRTGIGSVMGPETIVETNIRSIDPSYLPKKESQQSQRRKRLSL